jgi:ATP/maltotriose-dependent transcriptional regulator MalT
MDNLLQIIINNLILLSMLKYVLVENPMAASRGCKSITVTIKGAKINRRDVACRVSTVRELSGQTDKSRSVMQKTEEIQEQQSVKYPYRWQSIAPAIIALIAGCFIFFRH